MGRTGLEGGGALKVRPAGAFRGLLCLCRGVREGLPGVLAACKGLEAWLRAIGILKALRGTAVAASSPGQSHAYRQASGHGKDTCYSLCWQEPHRLKIKLIMHELSSMVWCTYRAANNYAIVIHVHDNHVLIIAESSLHCTQGTLIPSNHALDSQTL